MNDVIVRKEGSLNCKLTRRNKKANVLNELIILRNK